MPLINPFYYVLKQYEKVTQKSVSMSSSISSSSETTPVFLLEHKTSKVQEKNYYYVPLSVPDIDDLDYTILDPHITFFEHLNNSNDTGYHFTAILVKPNGDKFTLHVYFNHDGTVVVPDELSEKEKTIFLKLAQSKCAPIIEHIQGFQTHYQEMLAKEINEVIEKSKTVSVDKMDEIEQAQRDISSLIVKMNELSNVGGKAVKIKKEILSRLNDLEMDAGYLGQKTLSATAGNLGQKKESTDGKEHKKKEREIRKESSKPQKFFDKPSDISISQSASNSIKSQHASEEHEARKDFLLLMQKLKSVGGVLAQNYISQQNSSSSQLLECYSKGKEALASLLAYSVFAEEINLLDFITIDTYLTFTKALSINALENLIEKFDETDNQREADLLSHYCKYVSGYSVWHALKTKKYNLLSWLLNAGHFVIEELTLESNNLVLSILHYIVKNKDIHAFRIVLNHNAFLFVDNGAIYYQIMKMGPDNEFFKELHLPSRKILQAKQIISLLQVCLNDLEKLEKEKVKNLPEIERQKAIVKSAILKGTSFIKEADKVSAKSWKRAEPLFDIFIKSYNDLLKISALQPLYESALKNKTLMRLSSKISSNQMIQDAAKQYLEAMEKWATYQLPQMRVEELHTESQRVASESLGIS